MDNIVEVEMAADNPAWIDLVSLLLQHLGQSSARYGGARARLPEPHLRSSLHLKRCPSVAVAGTMARFYGGFVRLLEVELPGTIDLDLVDCVGCNTRSDA